MFCRRLRSGLQSSYALRRFMRQKSMRCVENALKRIDYIFFESERIKTQRFPINSRKNYALIRTDSDFRESSLAKKGLN